MFHLPFTLILFSVFAMISDGRIQLQRGLLSNADLDSVNQPYPYLFPHSPRAYAKNSKNFAKSAALENDDYDQEELDYDENREDEINYEDEDLEPKKTIKPSKEKIKQIKPMLNSVHSSFPRNQIKPEQSGALLVPDGIIEIEGERIYDEKTGQATLLVSNAALKKIPDGSIVALLDPKSISEDESALEEERANRVFVRRRKTGSRVNIRAGPKRRIATTQTNKPRSQGRSRRPIQPIYYLDEPYNRRNKRRRPVHVYSTDLN